MTPPPNSLRVWVCPNCGCTHTELGAGRHECPACEDAVLSQPVEYVSATDLEQLREALAVIATLDARTIGRRSDEMGMEAIGRRSQELARAALANYRGKSAGEGRMRKMEKLRERGE